MSGDLLGGTMTSCFFGRRLTKSLSPRRGSMNFFTRAIHGA
ncbi:hypothetical protein M6B38_117060 [Iris pallida]|uniref:Uncharacterized protein n=1 Tax=Iris pallida TaxID=29817 RepID=A0AAX6HS13_IRIPA|nr:hypothetical protein M6B38_117060 [Iris pallida]